jgi:hypothetical protein
MTGAAVVMKYLKLQTKPIVEPSLAAVYFNKAQASAQLKQL